MYKLNDFMQVLEERAPLSLSRKMIERGAYDNSGLLVKSSDRVGSVLFSLDLSSNSVKRAIDGGFDTIVPHHPAIYNPIKDLGVTLDTAPLLSAIKAGLNMISMHLNLDVCKGGIDDSLFYGLGGKDACVLDEVEIGLGYGKAGKVEKMDFSTFIKCAKETFKSDKIVGYGKGEVNYIASFCGSGASDAVDRVFGGILADTIITSDIPHHLLKELIENGKKVVILPHYVSEQYGFEKFYIDITETLKGSVRAEIYVDPRFM